MTANLRDGTPLSAARLLSWCSLSRSGHRLRFQAAWLLLAAGALSCGEPVGRGSAGVGHGAPGGGGLPQGFFPGTGRIEIQAGGRVEVFEPPLRTRWRSEAYPGGGSRSGAVAERCELESRSGAALIFHRELAPSGNPVRGRMAVRLDAALTAAGAAVRIDLYPGGPGSRGVPRRLEPPGDGGIAFLALGENAGAEVVDSIVDPGSGRAVHLLPLDPGTRIAGLPAGGLRGEARLDRPGEAPLLEWRAVETSLRLRAAPPPPPPFAAGGWGLFPSAGRPDDRSLLRLAARLEPLEPGPALRVIEIGPGWRPAPPAPPRRPAVEELAARGYRVALWLAPFGARPGRAAGDLPRGVVRDASGRPADGGQLGELVWDPTSADGRRAIEEAVRASLEPYGAAVAIVRLGLLPELLEFYHRRAGDLEARRRAGPLAQPAPAEAAAAALRQALEAARAGAGPGRWLAGDWGTPPEAAGLVDLARPSILPGDGGDLLRREAAAALRGYPLHRLGWIWEGMLLETGAGGDPGGLADADAFLAFVDLRAITGRSFQFAEPPGGLIEQRWPWIERALPPVEARPLFLDHEGAAVTTPPRLWVLKTALADGRRFDAIALFNWNPFAPERLTVPLEALRPGGGSEPVSGRYRVFDRRQERFLASAAPADALDFLLGPRSSRLISIHPPSGHPEVVGDSRHLIGGTVSVPAALWDPEERALRFRLAPGVPAGEAVRVHVALPAAARLRAEAVDAAGGSAEFERAGSHQVIKVRPQAGGEGEVEVLVRFREEPGELAPWRGIDPPAPRLRREPATGGVLIEWEGVPSGWAAEIAGYEVYRDGASLGRTTDTRFLDLEPGCAPGEARRYAVAIRRADGGFERPGPEVEHREPPVEDAPLSALAPAAIRQAWGFPGRDRSAAGGPLRLAGELCGRGIGAAAPSRLEYRLRGRYRRFRVRAGIDAAGGLGARAVFRVELDGREVFRSPALRHGDSPAAVDLDVAGGDRLALIAEEGGDLPSAGGPALVVWCDPMLTAAAP